MSTIQTRRPALQAQVSASLRFAAAVAVAALLALAWIGAEQASHQAVLSATAAITSSPVHAAPAPVQTADCRASAAVKNI
jgi:hypothetical protein